MIYERPLAYALGLEGVALLRAWAGEHDREFVDARIAEIRSLIDDDELAGHEANVHRVDSVDGYRVWSKTYGDVPNSMFDFEEPNVREIVDELPVGDALDAGCGTGRYAAYLAARGHRVIGVDSSPDMLAKARERVPGVEFRDGDLHRLPVDDRSTDLVVCGLALTHVPDLAPVIAEFARVLRPGGRLVVSDPHPDTVFLGSVPPVVLPDGRAARLPAYRHRIGDYLRAALSVGFQVRRCDEPSHSTTTEQPVPAAITEVGPWDAWPWCLAGFVPEADRAARAGTGITVVWEFELQR